METELIRFYKVFGYLEISIILKNVSGIISNAGWNIVESVKIKALHDKFASKYEHN